jgi:hypothetical protein
MFRSKNTKNNARKTSGRAGGRKPPRGISHPLQLDGYQITHGVTLRFTTGAAVEQVITFQNLLDTFLMAVTATAGADIFLDVKVRHLELWAAPLLGSAVTVAAAFTGLTAGVVGDQLQHTDTSMGIQPAHVRCRPSVRSLAATFQPSSGATAFTLNVPSGTVIDVGLTFRGAFGVYVPVQNPLVAATGGAVYLRGLDGLAIATTKFTPVALATASDAI